MHVKFSAIKDVVRYPLGCTEADCCSIIIIMMEVAKASPGCVWHKRSRSEMRHYVAKQNIHLDKA